ncbi:MAG TPA: DUF2089 domain-containing protein [Fimbriimonadaceae bacterium]|nr:DUF2089 domain-containing protein [Fimbriimonadaceae bacterium]
MSGEKHHRLPHKDPVSGGELYVSELANDDSGVRIRGKFEVPIYSRLDPDQANFLEVFLRSRGVLSTVEKELGLSYPTVRARLDQVLGSLGFAPINDAQANGRPRKSTEIIDMLEKGEITAEEAKARLRGSK